MRGLGVLLILMGGVQIARSQYYPRWFLEQGAIECATTAVGYAVRGFYADSSVSQASLNARMNLARQQDATVEMKQAFWTTEIGTAWMGGDVRIAYDSLALSKARSDTGRAAFSVSPGYVVALASDGGCPIPDSLLEEVVMPPEEPSWVYGTPADRTLLYSLGAAPKYYYETSSWQSAERMALLGLAKAGGDSVAAIEKSAGGSGQEVLDESVSVRIGNYRVVARWYDSRNEIYYVLMSVKRDDMISRQSASPGY